MTAADTLLVVYARAPQPGAVKTRLIPLLGADGAAALHARLVEHALEIARESSQFAVELHCAPGTGDPFFRFCADHYGVRLRTQSDGDLGARMLASCQEALAEHARVLLIGSDCPALTTHHLQEAERSLRDGADAAFVPCEDGGYALIGLTRTAPELFDGIAWGSDRVMAETRARLRQLGWNWRELETLWDVDRPDDYRRLVDSGLLDGHRATT